jgi:hypothetical protein
MGPHTTFFMFILHLNVCKTAESHGFGSLPQLPFTLFVAASRGSNCKRTTSVWFTITFSSVQTLNAIRCKLPASTFSKVISNADYFFFFFFFGNKLKFINCKESIDTPQSQLRQSGTENPQRTLNSPRIERETVPLRPSVHLVAQIAIR